MGHKDRRDCGTIIKQMLNHIPMSESVLREELEWNLNDAQYKAPEETIQWERTSETLNRHIKEPIKNWEFEVCSIFSTVPVEKLREISATAPEFRQ